MKQSDFDVLVIGGGHAGTEAASAAGRYGARTALITLNSADIGTMSCNPAIGGLGKGHLVREIDALDGLMGRVADYAGIQFRLLNKRKGPAVQGPRAQADRSRYREGMQKAISLIPNLTVVHGEVVDLIQSGETVTGVVLADGSEVTARSVVLTSGTFLNGVIHVGDVSQSGGRMGDKASKKLADRLLELNMPTGRLKTGTPPRLDGNTIQWDELDSQPGDDDPILFSFLSKEVVARQVSCGITHTNPRTHDIIRENLDRSAMYGGHIDGVGPRYCPSIEDKIVRFADKESHQVFLEPEGLNTSTVYPNGISTSLPLDIQNSYVRSIKGLENVEIVQPGYAIEYDYFDPRSLTLDLRVKDMGGLYFAGQINGTTGYEEAGAQGLIAGLNAAASALEKDSIRLSRTDSYIGVMLDDLTTRGVSEPYRMFTSRAEFRLALRADNADQRLTPLAIERGLASEERSEQFIEKKNKLEQAQGILETSIFSPNQVKDLGISVNQDGVKRSAYQLLAFQDISTETLKPAIPALCDVDRDILDQLEREALYASYISRQKRDVESIKKDSTVSIPLDFDFSGLSGLSNELKGKLKASRPENLEQASRIEGMTPAAISLILAKLRQFSRRSAS